MNQSVYIENRRQGRVRVNVELVDALDPVVGCFLSTCFILSAVRYEELGYVEYTAVHPSFAPSSDYPLYKPEFSKRAVTNSDGSTRGWVHSWSLG